MTEAQTPSESPIESVDAGTSTDSPGSTADPDNGSQGDTRPDKAKLSSEAAKWRTSFREAEAKLADANTRIDGFLRAEAERAAGEYLGVPSDLWSGGLRLADVLDDDGNVDAEAIKANAETIIAERGDRFAKNQRAVDPSQGLGSANGRPPISWEGLFRQ